jgi:NAD(P)H-hydrate epimerase
VPNLALDVPSGLNATTGASPGARIRAHTTLTLALPKTGHSTEDIGELWLAAKATHE